ncbi:SRPBCC domain-containing protein [Streptomyces carpaticus]|uniref:SRPBCC domain-containing protein n=1 Tax=Streptomyces carpaticus TaxID=285558 RepID=A0ABV4ZI01_9ACTN
MTEKTEITSWLNDTYREVGRRPVPEGEARTILIRRHYPARLVDVWDAVTDPAQLAQWFLPVDGELELGGHFRIEGNASGEILRCEAPNLLAVTWDFGTGPSSEVIVRLADVSATEAALELEQAPVPDVIEMDGRRFDPVLNDYDTGLFGLGTGWELALISLGRFLRGEPITDPAAWEEAPEVQNFAVRCGEIWAELAQEEARERP